MEVKPVLVFKIPIEMVGTDGVKQDYIEGIRSNLSAQVEDQYYILMVFYSAKKKKNLTIDVQGINVSDMENVDFVKLKDEVYQSIKSLKK